MRIFCKWKILIIVSFITSLAIPSFGFQNGKVLWKYKVGNIATGTFSVALGEKNNLYAVSSDGYLYSFNKNGNIVWKKKIGTSIEKSYLTIDSNYIYVSINNDFLMVFNTKGDLVYNSNNSDSFQNFLSSLALNTDKNLYVVENGSLCDLNISNGQKDTIFKPELFLVSSILGVGTNKGIYLQDSLGRIYLVNTRGNVNWTYSVGEYLAGYTDINSYPALDKNGTIYMAIDTNPYSKGKLIAISTAGKNKWSLPISGVFMSSPAIGEDGVIFIGSSSGYLYAINPNGTIKWKLDIGNNCGIGCRSTVSIGSDDTIYFSLGDSVYAINNEGNLLWKAVLDSNIETPVFVGDGILYLETESGTIYAISSSSNGLLNSSWPITGHDNRNTRNVNSKIEYISNNQDNNTNNNGPGNITNPKSNFSDISPTDWYYTYVQDIAKAGITTGYPDGTYKPDVLVTRAQMAAFIARAMKLNVPKECNNSPFYDIDTSKWYCKYVEAIKDAGVTSGYSDGSYKPNEYVTRAIMAAYIAKALHLNIQPCTTKPFVDVPTDAWYCPYVQAIKNAGITSGYPDGTYKPDVVVTRAMMAAFIDKAFLKNGNNSSSNNETQAKSIASFTTHIFEGSLDTFSSLFNYLPLRSDLTLDQQIKFDSIIKEQVVPLLYGFVYSKDNAKFTRSTESGKENCPGGGYYTYSGDYDENSGYLNATFNYNNCEISDPSIGFDAVFNGYLKANGYYNLDNISLSISSNNFSAKETYNVYNYSLNYSKISYTFLLNSESKEIKLSGSLKMSFSESDNGYNYHLTSTYSNLDLSEKDVNGTEEYYYLNGTVGYSINPETICPDINGTYTFKTVDPVIYDEAEDEDISGEIDVNNNEKIVFNYGTVTIYLNGKEIYSGNENEVYSICSIKNLNSKE